MGKRDLSRGNGTAYKSSFMQSVLPQIPRCDMVLLHCSQGSMQIDRFPCKFDSYSIGINFGLPKVKRKAARLPQPMKAKEWGFAPNEDKKTCLSLVLCPSSLLLVRRFCTLGKNDLKTRHCVFWSHWVLFICTI